MAAGALCDSASPSRASDSAVWSPTADQAQRWGGPATETPAPQGVQRCRRVRLEQVKIIAPTGVLPAAAIRRRLKRPTGGSIRQLLEHVCNVRTGVRD